MPSFYAIRAAVPDSHVCVGVHFGAIGDCETETTYVRVEPVATGDPDIEAMFEPDVVVCRFQYPGRSSWLSFDLDGVEPATSPEDMITLPDTDDVGYITMIPTTLALIAVHGLEEPGKTALMETFRAGAPDPTLEAFSNLIGRLGNLCGDSSDDDEDAEDGDSGDAEGCAGCVRCGGPLRDKNP